METPTQASWRRTKRRKSKKATNGKSGDTERQGRLRTGEDPTQSVASNADQYIPRNNGSSSSPAVGDLVSVHEVLALHLTGGAFCFAVGDMGSQDTEPRYVGFGVFDRKIHAMSVPERWNISKEVFDDGAKAQPGHTENNNLWVDSSAQNIPLRHWFHRSRNRSYLGLSPLLETGRLWSHQWTCLHHQYCSPPHHHRIRPCYPTLRAILRPVSLIRFPFFFS